MTPRTRTTLFLCLSVGASAQSGSSLAGAVKDAITGSPIPGINLILKGATKGTTTNQDGQFEIITLSEDANPRIESLYALDNTRQTENKSQNRKRQNWKCDRYKF